MLLLQQVCDVPAPAAALACKNGHWQVLFVVNTSDEYDLAYLTVLMERNAEYRRLDLPGAQTLSIRPSRSVLRLTLS